MAELNESNKKAKPSLKTKNKAAKVAALRNRFFYMTYRQATMVFMASLASFAFSVVFLLFFANHPIPPQYIPINEDGTYIKLEPLSQCKKDSDVASFAIKSMEKLYRYDYVNYPSQFQESASNFTISGWKEFLQDLGASGTLTAVKANHWVVSMEPHGAPLILKKWTEGGVCKWELKTNIKIIYHQDDKIQEQSGDLYMKIDRYSVIENPDGLGIEKIIFSEQQ